MSLLGNILWLIFGGFFMFLEYLVAGIGLCLTIIGIPFGIQVLKISMLALFPFGQEVGNFDHSGNSTLLFIMNIIWLIFGGIWICLSHLTLAFILAITIIGFPFAVQHLKLAKLALFPFGQDSR